MTRRPAAAARWAVPAAAVVLVAGTAVAGAAGARADVDLPDRTPAEVLELARAADVAAFEADVRTSSALGLPSLPTSGGRGDHERSGLDPLALLSGDREWHVAVDGPQRQAVQVFGDLTESRVVRDGREVWTYDHATRTAKHVVLPEHGEHGGGDDGRPAGEAPATPQDLGERLVEAVDPTTDISVEEGVRVAGREAYQLVLRPEQAGSLVEAATLAVDASTGMVLRVQVDAAGQDDPAFAVEVTDLELGTPDADRFAFTPPPGTEVEEVEVPAHGAEGGHGGLGDGDGRAPVPPSGAQPPARVVGEGWTSVLVVDTGGAALPADGPLASLLEPVDGGAQLRTALVTVLRTDDGRVLVGAVTPEVLRAAAGLR